MDLAQARGTSSGIDFAGPWAIEMVKLWAISAGILACLAGIAALRARRKRADSEYNTEPVSSEWLAQARGREEHGW